MSRLPDGRERIVTFALPLSLMTVAQLLSAVREALEAQGYTDVRYHQDGYVVATPPSSEPAR